ncbi:MAG TPA: endonuclease MutS2 [Dehalococcoidia bacterium]|nr:endonuclease MutS2 [Dehalococcoidia bacterium]
MDDKSLEMLEFPRIREKLAEHTRLIMSRELALGLKPGTDYERISLLLRQTAEARQLLALDRGFAVGEIPDIRAPLKMASLQSVLEPQNLLEIQRALSSLHHLRHYLGASAADFPLLWDIAGGIVELNQVERDIAGCIDASGEVVDTASPDLADIRRQLRETREQILERLEGIIRSPRGKRVLQEDIITEREGRYVILVKIECRHDIRGIVHDISNTGATVFMEPTSTVGLGNALRELVIEERREVERILGLLTAEVGAHSDEILNSIYLAAELDLVLAKARYAAKIKATEPVIIDSDKARSPKKNGQSFLKLVNAKHPLLGDKAVPFSLEIGHDYSILVITGPNTGGKTVTLKTIGLLSLMTQAGISIPALGESQLPLFDGVFADIGDEQSIEQTLSSFSWHMGNVVRIIKRATSNSLVLLDELGTSTDPAEGSALARAILRYFLDRKTMTVATTHYGDLKAFAYTTDGMENASLEFDPATFQPTYQLTVGIPGGSNAMATAARLGIPLEIIDDARTMLTEGSQELENLLNSLMVEKQKTESLLNELAAEKNEFSRRNAELEKEQTRLETDKRHITQEARDRILSEAAELHKEIRKAAAELRKKKSAESIGQARETLKEVRQQLDSEAWKLYKSHEQETEPETIKVGDDVWIKEAGLAATVLAISEETREVDVQAGRTKMRLGIDGIAKITEAPGKATPVSGILPHIKSIPLQLDLRGRRADEIEPEVDSYLNDAVRSGASQVRIIHGIGTGTVRNIVREYLSKHPLVKNFRSGERDEGGDGATVVSLK